MRVRLSSANPKKSPLPPHQQPLLTAADAPGLPFRSSERLFYSAPPSFLTYLIIAQPLPLLRLRLLATPAFAKIDSTAGSGRDPSGGTCLRMQTLAPWVSLLQNRSALAAAERVADCVCSRCVGMNSPARLAFKPLLLHGPAGAGKTHLVAGFAALVVERRPDFSASAAAWRAGGFCPQMAPVRATSAAPANQRSPKAQPDCPNGPRDAFCSGMRSKIS
jgi:hypothetical protein